MYSRSSLILASLSVGAGLIVIITVATMISARAAKSSSGWSISAKALRDSYVTYEESFQPKSKDKSWNGQNYFNEINPSARHSVSDIIISYQGPNYRWPGVLYDYSVERLDVSQITNGIYRLPLGETGEVELKVISGMDWSRDDYDWTSSSYQEIDPVFYSPKGELLDESQVEAMGDFLKHNKPHFRGVFPEYGFHVQVSGIPEEDYSLMNMQLWDAQTHYMVSEGGYNAMRRNSGHYFISKQVGVWRKTPVDLMFDFAIGPKEVTEVSIDQIGQFFESEYGGFAVIAIGEGSRGNWRTTSRSRMVEMTLQLNPDIKKSSVVALAEVSKSGNEPLELKAFDHQGNELKTYSQGSSGVINLYRVEGAKDDIAGFRVSTLSRHVRLIYSLPFLPGYPEGNENLDNLLDQRIPYLHINDYNEFQRAIEKMTQARTTMNHTIANRAMPHIQKDHKDMTVYQLLYGWNAITPQAGVMVDSRGLEIDLTASNKSLIQMLDQLF